MFRFDLPSCGRATRVLSIGALFLALVSFPLFGQNLASTASISGIVADPAGARVADATVTIVNPDRGISRTFKTYSTGTFSFSLLPPAVYSLKVEASGFKTYQQKAITLEVGQAAGLSVVLPVGNVGEHVEVTSETPLLTTDNANLASEITGKQIVELPLNFRNVFGLAFLDSSVTDQNIGGGGGQDTADQDISFLNFGGQFMGSSS